MLYLPPLGTFGALHPFLQSIAFLLLHGACERLAGEGLIIILFIQSLICFIPILNALLLTASGITYHSSTVPVAGPEHSCCFCVYGSHLEADRAKQRVLLVKRTWLARYKYNTGSSDATY